MEPFTELLEKSKTDRTGIVFYVDGHAIPGIVTSVHAGYVEVRNREHDRIVILTDRISAVAGN